jgi:quercetin dioxygenase-like cupin family protein
MKLSACWWFPALFISAFCLLALMQYGQAAEPLEIVNLGGKFKPCGPDGPAGCEHILLRGDPQAEPSHHVYRLAKGFIIPKHWHDSAENLIVVRGMVVIGSEVGGERTLRPGDYVHIPAGNVHWGQCPDQCVFYLGVEGADSFYVVEESQ